MGSSGWLWLMAYGGKIGYVATCGIVPPRYEPDVLSPPPMPSEKAKENKQLVAACAGCAKQFSTEVLTGVVVGSGRQRQIVAVCDACRQQGWDPSRVAGADDRRE